MKLVAAAAKIIAAVALKMRRKKSRINARKKNYLNRLKKVKVILAGKQ